uniref:Phosphatidylinositol 3-kinase catalytic subunit type 3 n=1 Tax=Meloidogyne incognita TaxID=6306 RepID=A0A914LH10_MELIC
MRKNFNYVFSSEINVPLRIRLVSLSGYLTSHGDMQRYATPSGCMFVRLTIYCNGRIIGRSVQSSFRQYLPSGTSSIRDIQKFDEWINLPVNYSDLNRDALLHVTLWDVGTNIEPVLIAQCAKKLFSKHSIFRSGILDLKLEQVIGKSDKTKLINENSNLDLMNIPTPAKQAESSEDARDSTPLLKNNDENLNNIRQLKCGIPLNDLLKKEKLYNQKFIDRVDWLDKITFAKLEEIKQEAKSDDRSLFLTIEFPIVQDSDDLTIYSIIYFAGEAPSSTDHHHHSQQFENDLDVDPLLPKPRNERQTDPELDMENLSEIKHHMMTRNARAMDIDRRLQPNPTIRDTLEAIIKSASCQAMLMEERDLIWKFRFWLKSNPKALTKFIRSVNWQEKLEVRQAIQVILEWEPIDACDALELLSPNFSHPFVRRYAVSRLQSTTNANILLFLPQLVQALRYEPSQQDLLASVEEDLLVVTQNENVSGTSTIVATSSNSVHPRMASSRQSTNSDIPLDYFEGHESMDLATFLIKIACQNSPIAIFLYWYLKVEVEANFGNKQISEFYSSVILKLQQALSSGNSACKQTLATISSQKKFVDTLVDIAKSVADSSGSRSKKLELLKKKLIENNDLIDLKGMSLPLDPSVHVKSVQPESTTLFSSNLMPMRLTFSTVRGNITPYECAEAYTTIFKRGDDLRQDQLVLQMIRLMDSLLKEDKLVDDLLLIWKFFLGNSLVDIRLFS